MAGESAAAVPQVSALLATGGYDNIVKMWGVESGTCLRTFSFPSSQVNAIAISPDRKGLAASGYETIRLYDLHSNNPNPTANYNKLSKNIADIGFNKDGNLMFTCGEDCHIRVWDMRADTNSCQMNLETRYPLNSICIHPNDTEFIVGDEFGIIHLWDFKSGHHEQFVLDPNKLVQCVAVNHGGNVIASVDTAGKCHMWEYNKNSPKLQYKRFNKAHSSYALYCKFSPDSTLLATSSADNTACVWNTGTMLLKQTFTEQDQRWVWSTAFTNDSKHLLTASSDCKAKLWNIESGCIECEYIGHEKAITALSFRDVPT